METRVILLGTAGGALTWPPSDGVQRAGTSSALVVGDSIYLIDLGMGAGRQLVIADPLERGYGTVFRDLAAVFITHLHSDHVLDLPALVLSGYEQGWPAHRVPIYGPWSRTMLPEAYPQGRVPAGGTTTPGTARLTEAVIAGFSADTLDRIASSAKPSPVDMVIGIDIKPPTPAARHHHPGVIVPFEVYQDDRVRVVATLGEHGTMYPALAYRFDTAAGSAVFSGDTAPSANVIALAEGADLLVHECIDDSLVSWGLTSDSDPERLAYMRFVLSKHTTASQVGGVASAAGVHTLVLNHLVPGHAPREHWLASRDRFAGDVIVGRDFDVFRLPRP